MIKKLQITLTAYKEFPISDICDVLCVKSENGRPVVYVNDRGKTLNKVLCISIKTTGTDAPEGFHYLGTVLYQQDTNVEHYFYRIKS